VSFVLEQTSEGVDIVVTGAWSPAAAEHLRSGRADGLDLNYARGFQEGDLEFLQGLTVRRLHVLDRTISDLTPIYNLADGLVSLRVQSDPGATIELDQLPLLQKLAAGWRQVQGSIRFAPKLEELFLLSYSEPDLAPLGALNSLVSLAMKDRPKLRSLDGVEDFPWLAELGVFLAKDLQDISALQRAPSPVLKTLQLGTCRRVSEIGPVAACSGLRFFELSDGSEIPTIAPLAGLDQLERLYLWGSTRIADGDLRPIAALPRLNDLRIANRREYTPSVQEIQEIIEQRA
jgi:hypothetical protein